MSRLVVLAARLRRAGFAGVLTTSALCLSLSVLTACGSAETDYEEDDAQASGDTAGTDDATTTADTSGDTTVTPGPTTFTPACDSDAKCSGGKSCVDGVCVQPPSEVAVLSNPKNDNLPDETEAFHLGCVGKTHAELLAGHTGPSKVTIWGRVDRFGGGSVTENVQVDVFRTADFHPENCPTEACLKLEDELERDTCMQGVLACLKDENKVGKPIASAVSINPTEAVANGLDVQTEKAADELCVKGQHLTCPSGYECRKAAEGDIKCILTHGIYAVENVPTGESLVVRVRGLNAQAKWYDSYYWDLVLFPDRTDAKGATTQPKKYIDTDTYRFNPTIVGQGQWSLVPNTMGLNDIRYGYGVIGGRIRDCGVDGGRGGWPIHKATVGLGVPAQGIAYFNDNEDDTVPVKTRSYTDTIGRFAAVDVPPGPNRLSAMAKVDGTVKSLGGFDVYVVPNSLTIISTPGRIPVLSK